MPGRSRRILITGLSTYWGGRLAQQLERARWEAEIPMRRLGEPREFAALAAFLASERASYITGVNLLVDGGVYKGSM